MIASKTKSAAWVCVGQLNVALVVRVRKIRIVIPDTNAMKLKAAVSASNPVAQARAIPMVRPAVHVAPMALAISGHNAIKWVAISRSASNPAPMIPPVIPVVNAIAWAVKHFVCANQPASVSADRPVTNLYSVSTAEELVPAQAVLHNATLDILAARSPKDLLCVIPKLLASAKNAVPAHHASMEPVVFSPAKDPTKGPALKIALKPTNANTVAHVS
jgi:hypothetical protein